MNDITVTVHNKPQTQAAIYIPCCPRCGSTRVHQQYEGYKCQHCLLPMSEPASVRVNA